MNLFCSHSHPIIFQIWILTALIEIDNVGVQNGAPEMVARKLNRMIADHPTLLRNKSSGLNRPLLVILDRNTDLITPIQHTSTYQALIDDMLAHKANRVEFDVTTETGGTYDGYRKDLGRDPSRISFSRSWDVCPPFRS